MTEFDIIVVGGGPGGYIAATTAAKYGFSVALIEKDASQGGGLGGTCLNRGCIPSKTWLDNAETIERIKNASKRGIMAQGADVDMPSMVKFKDRVVKRLSMGVGALLKSWNVTVFTGTATVHRLDNITVMSADGNEIQLSCKKLILATGARPATIPIKGVELPQVLSSDNIFNIQSVPDRLAIVGGGVIGVEMARIFSAFGSKVTILEALPRITPNLDDEVADALAKSLKSSKVTVKTSVKVEAIEGNCDGGEVNVVISTGSAEERIPADIVLMAIGRTPNTEAFSELNLKMNRRFVDVGYGFQTSYPDVYAIGDLTGLSMLAHSASLMGERVAKNIAINLGRLDPSECDSLEIDFANIPSVVYGEPSAAAVGMSEKTAIEFCQANELTLSTGRTIFGANGRAVASGMGDGFIKVLVGKSGKYSAQILGVHIFGPMASELVNEASVLINGKIDAYRATDVVHAHPTFSEALSVAIHDALGGSSHQPPKK